MNQDFSLYLQQIGLKVRTLNMKTKPHTYNTIYRYIIPYSIYNIYRCAENEHIPKLKKLRDSECVRNQNIGKITVSDNPNRIDIQCEISAVPFEDLSRQAQGESSAAIRERVIKARKIQEERYKDYPGIHCNAQMTERMIHQYCEPSPDALEMLKQAMERFSLSARAYTRILKVARTIADLAGSATVTLPHIAEAISYRALDRSDWCERL